MGNSDFPRAKAQTGYTYLILLLMVMVMGLSASLASEVWHTTIQRAREKQLLFVGNQYRQAIKHYYDESPGAKTYPHKLEELVKDERFPGIKRHLRRLYTDPITESQDWGLAMDPVNGTIQGVYSLSVATPMKTGRFTKENLDFEGKVKYSDWRFIYVPEDENAAPPTQETVPQEGE